MRPRATASSSGRTSYTPSKLQIARIIYAFVGEPLGLSAPMHVYQAGQGTIGSAMPWR
jgi:hypothetical protein